MITGGPVTAHAKFAPDSPDFIDGLIDLDLLIPRLHADTKIGAIKELVDLMHRKGIVDDSLSFLQSVLERENLQSTILGGDVALPHARSRSVRELGLALGLARPPIDFPSGDDRRSIHLICLIAVPAHAPDLYLELLANLAHILRDPAIKQSLLHAGSADDLYQRLSSHSVC